MLLVAIFFGILRCHLLAHLYLALVVFYGIIMCIIFIVPIGVIKSITGVEVNLGILAEFIGGSIVPGNALAMNYMKAYGYVKMRRRKCYSKSSREANSFVFLSCSFVTCSHAIWFSNDLKLAHYIKIPQRQTFAVQMFAALISTFVCTAVLNFQV